MYSIPSFSLRKGARAAVAVWQARLDLRHLYTLDDFRADDWGSMKHTVNNHSDVEWSLELDSGETTRLEYVTGFYIR